MIVKVIYKDKERDYFRDKETADKIEEQVKRHYGDIFECSDELAEERIKKGLVKKASKKEEKEYLDSIDTNDDDDLKPIDGKSTEENSTDNGKTDSNEDSLPTDNDESTKIKSLEECTMEELIQIAQAENIELFYPKDNTAQDVIIETINKVRAERLEQSNGGEE